MMGRKKGEDIQIELADQVKGAMADDPALAAAMREMFANMRQAMQAVDEGRYKTFEDAMEALTGNRPKRVDLGEC